MIAHSDLQHSDRRAGDLEMDVLRLQGCDVGTTEELPDRAFGPSVGRVQVERVAQLKSALPHVFGNSDAVGDQVATCSPLLATFEVCYHSVTRIILATGGPEQALLVDL